MKRFTLLLLVVFLFSTLVQAAEYVPFSRSAGRQATKSLVSDLGDTVRFNVNIPGLWLEKVNIDGEEFTKINVEGSSITLEKGKPELRKMTSFIAVPYSQNARVEIADMNFEVIENVRILPSKGNILRNVNPADVAYEFDSNVYGQDVNYPTEEEIAKVSKPFIMRDISGVRVELVPFQYNDEKRTLKVLKDVSLRVSVQATRGMTSRRVNYTGSEEFENLYSDVFMNYTQPSYRSRAYSAPEQTKHLLIVAADKFYNATKPLVDWKIKQGFKVDFKNFKDIGRSANDLQKYITKKYNQGELCFITLVGDIDDIPCRRGKNEGADSDHMYVKLAGNDNIPDAFISRISVSTEEECEAVVAKTVRYEAEPSMGLWYKRALAIASNEGNPADYERTDELNESLAEYGFGKFYKCYAPDYQNPDYSEDKSVIFDAVEDGVSIINYIGHGSSYRWVTSGFNTSDAARVQNGMELPVIWSVACVNGDIAKDVCFAEAWLRSGDENGGGCIGIAAATTNMAWVPPCVWQGEINHEQTAKQKHTIATVQNMYGMLKTMEEYGTDDRSYGNQLVEQVIYFGEGSVSLRSKQPVEVRAEAVMVDGEILVSIDGDVREGVTVTAYDEKLERNISKVSDRRGYVTIPYEGQTKVTVWHKDIVPVVDLEIEK